ncbi:LCP family protein [Salipaludibacillus sp. LMS25]|jgi:LCP family protein required for cell wall assembly|uniref:LCP family protein n=1 Tax=Salipaludibacillus sp. LMS25 TaxID=2924031 RepID=UPI0020D05125|nr:LCP family protein [Salipaludibacillus sp. LMS25]UTR16179.1 LCP family protein [Salipaludibacillus sp. LMS25]
MLLTFLGVFILAAGALAYMVHQLASVTSSAQQELERGDRSELREEAVNPDIDPVSILFLGLDTRDGDLSGRTDAMLLLTFNPDEGTVKMLNIPRDSRVNISGRYEQDKINHAHAYGGIDMTVETVEKLFDIPVDYYVSLNFDAFMEIIDDIGGITVDSPLTFTETDNATYGTLTIYEGEQQLNGEEALAYVRMRKSDPAGDLGRGERQKEVIEAVIHEMASFSTITRFNSLMDTIERNLDTNASFNDIVALHSYANELDNIVSLNYEGTDYVEEGVYYFVPDQRSIALVSQQLQKHLGLRETIDSYLLEPIETQEPTTEDNVGGQDIEGDSTEDSYVPEETDVYHPQTDENNSGY